MIRLIYEMLKGINKNIDKNLLKNVELAERYLLVHGVLESKDEREKR